MSEYELLETALFEGIDWLTFQKLDGKERALLVAHKRAHKLIEEHQLAAASLNRSFG